MSSPSPEAEWLEADGLGGFASGTVLGARTRRYHALLLTATTPPTGRFVLVNGLEAWVSTPKGTYALSSQRYVPDVTHPDGAHRIEGFEREPWPRWHYRLEDGTLIEHELFVPHEASVCVLRWRVIPSAAAQRDSVQLADPSRSSCLAEAGSPIRLLVRPLISGRDYHSLHHENSTFCFEAEVQGEHLTWQPYRGLPAVRALTNGTYRSAAEWYRNFQYDEERARGLDFTEDLAAPGVIEWELEQAAGAVLVLAADGHAARAFRDGEPAGACAERLAATERSRREGFASQLHRAADSYVVRRGEHKTIVAGYPWFTDWGRDTFIAMRGLCIDGDRLCDARDILLGWAGVVSQGMLPNRFPDGASEPEYNAVDASLWFVIAVHDLLAEYERRELPVEPLDRRVFASAVEAILDGYARGTRYGIGADDDGLLAAGEPGVQLTWMDAKIGDWVVTPRTGKPVEVQALWINALEIAATISVGAERWHSLATRARDSFTARFWDEQRGCLYDVVDVDHVPGAVDRTLRPNQVFAAGGLPHPLIEGEAAQRMLGVIERELLTPLGLRSLAPTEPGYTGRYEGDARCRDSIYHQGAVWPWLIGAFVDAWVRVRGGGAAAKAEARARFLPPLYAHLEQAGLGHLSEIADAEPPHTPRGCPFQAWSLGEMMRLELRVLADPHAAEPMPGVLERVRAVRR